MTMAEPEFRSERDDAERLEARTRLEKRRGLWTATVAYVVINGFFVLAWAVTGGGYFWPGWLMAAWGAGLVLGFWDSYRRPITDADIDKELQRRRS